MADEQKTGGGPELELNLASGLIATILEKDLLAFIRRAQEAGFPNFCALPFRGLKESGAPEKLKDRGISVVHIQNAWRPTQYDPLVPALIAGAYGSFMRKGLGRDCDLPLFPDSLFPSSKTSARIVSELMEAFPGAKVVSLEANLSKIPNNRFLLEIHPGLEMEKEAIAAWAQENQIGLVFDPDHLLNEASQTISFPGQPTRPGHPWEKELAFFAQKGLIEVVDIHPPMAESPGSHRQISELKDLAQAARNMFPIRYLKVEACLPIGDQLPIVSRKREFPILAQIAQTLKEA